MLYHPACPPCSHGTMFSRLETHIRQILRVANVAIGPCDNMSTSWSIGTALVRCATEHRQASLAFSGMGNAGVWGV